ncbi:DUF5916 domain-containing protein [Acidobacteriota bacterium]
MKKEKIKLKSHKILTFLLIGTVSFFSAYASPQEKKELLIPYKTSTPPKIDGVLDDPVWQNSPQDSGFQTYHPDYGKNMIYDTIVYYAYDEENLYYAFRCFDSEPDKIKASVKNRDNIRSDDWIGINLDTFGDNQSLYSFYVNPLGIQQDSKSEGGTEDFTVDVVWYSHGIIDDNGYTIEIKIPLKSIRFSPRDPVEMGIIFERKITRHTEVGTFPPLDPAKGQNWFIQTRPILYQGVKHSRPVEILPAATYSRNSAAEEGKMKTLSSAGDVSLTAKVGITSDLILDGTYNPDFSQVEADTGQVDFNLRYSLFFPETRPFFQEGLEKFNFGGSKAGDPLSEIVHTRTIIDPIMGFKLNGKIGEKNVIASIYAMDELPETQTENEKYAHFSIFRYKRVLSQDSFIGGFYTGREQKNRYNRVYGVDGQIRISNPSFLGFHFLQSQTNTSVDKESESDDGHSLSLHYSFDTSKWIFQLGLQDIGKNFQTETGYISRAGLTQFRLGVLRMLQLDSKLIKRIDPMIHSNQILDKFSNLWETVNRFDVNFILPRSTSVLLGGRYSTEVFSQKRFSTSGLRFRASSQFTKNLFFMLSYAFGSKIRYVADPYQGKGNDASAMISFLPMDKLDLSLSVIYTDFSRASNSDKEYDYMIFRSRNIFQMNKYLFFRAIVEYNSFWKQVMTDFLASFTYIPGTVFHIGYGSLYEKTQWVEGQYRPGPNFLETKRGFFIKASYLWRW